MTTPASCSLYFRSGTSDKVYNIQLVNTSAGWEVHAQYGRRGSSLTSLVKAVTPNYSVAVREYNALRDSKTSKGYTVGALSGKSLAVSSAPAAPAAPPKPAEPLPTVPSWAGFSDFYAECATLLGRSSSLFTDPQGDLVLMADIAGGLQDGVVDAVREVRACKKLADVPSLLSGEGKAWYELLSDAQKTQFVTDLHSACKKAKV